MFGLGSIADLIKMVSSGGLGKAMKVKKMTLDKAPAIGRFMRGQKGERIKELLRSAFGAAAQPPQPTSPTPETAVGGAASETAVGGAAAAQPTPPTGGVVPEAAVGEAAAAQPPPPSDEALNALRMLFGRRRGGANLAEVLRRRM